MPQANHRMRSRRRDPSLRPLTVILVMTASFLIIAGLFHLIAHFAVA